MAALPPPCETTEVVVIGNGPSGISLSYMLSGHWPYYSGAAHSNEYLHLRLTDGGDSSLIEQELSYLCDGLEGRSSNPVSLLLDALTHPDADSGLEQPSLLQWRRLAEKAIPHVVLGKHHAGGAWQTIEGGLQTLSLGNWMSLPNQPFKAWVTNNNASEHSSGPTLTSDRATVEQVREYYRNYVTEMNLSGHMRPHSTVTSVQRVYLCKHKVDDESGEQNLCCADGKRCGQFIWEVRGQEKLPSGATSDICIRAPNVVLAVGSYDLPLRLGVPGESDEPYVRHGLSDIEAGLAELGPLSDPVLVVGAGLSAADTILSALSRNIPVIHCFRRKASDHSIVYNKLPAAVYPEYHRVKAMMRGEAIAEGYTPYQQHHVVSLNSYGRVLLRGPDDLEVMVTCSMAAVQIGARPNLSFLPAEGRHLGVSPSLPVDSKHNTVAVDPYTHQCLQEPGLFAMGPLVGDNFVRFLRGGALAITAHLHRKRQGALALR